VNLTLAGPHACLHQALQKDQQVIAEADARLAAAQKAVEEKEAARKAALQKAGEHSVLKLG
jgi:nucleoid-associated protein YgaU